MTEPAIERRIHGGRGVVSHDDGSDRVAGWPEVAYESIRALNHLTGGGEPMPAPTLYQVLGELKMIGHGLAPAGTRADGGRLATLAWRVRRVRRRARPCRERRPSHQPPEGSGAGGEPDGGGAGAGAVGDRPTGLPELNAPSRDHSGTGSTRKLPERGVDDRHPPTGPIGLKELSTIWR